MAMTKQECYEFVLEAMNAPAGKADREFAARVVAKIMFDLQECADALRALVNIENSRVY